MGEFERLVDLLLTIILVPLASNRVRRRCWLVQSRPYDDVCWSSPAPTVGAQKLDARAFLRVVISGAPAHLHTPTPPCRLLLRLRKLGENIDLKQVFWQNGRFNWDNISNALFSSINSTQPMCIQTFAVSDRSTSLRSRVLWFLFHWKILKIDWVTCVWSYSYFDQFLCLIMRC